MRRPEVVRTAIVTIAVMLFFADLHTCQAKRGCSAFGHSCFGGHGKRMDSSAPMLPSAPEEVAYDQQAGLRDVVFTAPRSDPTGISAQGPPPLALLEIMAALRRQQQEKVQDLGRFKMQDSAYELAPYLRQWAYRNSQDIRQTNM